VSEENAPDGGVLLPVLVATPAHRGLTPALTYSHTTALPEGTLVRVPLGNREVLGMVWGAALHSGSQPSGTDVSSAALKPIAAVLEGLPPLNERWRRLLAFAGRYYQRSAGEVALAALPPPLRDLQPVQLQRKLKKLAQLQSEEAKARAEPAAPTPELTEEQAAALAAIATNAANAPPGTPRPPVLLFGATGSGKTEVYLRAVEDLLAQDPAAQALIMVPEINLTPQLEARFVQRFAQGAGQRVVSLHSGLTPAQRLNHWLAAHLGQARIVLGTRMAVFASLPRLRLIVVDEEHDPSYKSQEGARYSARDLAVYRASIEPSCQVILGSATPSLESWHAAEQGRYVRLAMPQRMGGGALPRLKLVDMNHQPKHTVVAPSLVAAMAERIARGEQVMVLLNRRGYAPVLACHDCGWKSDCPHCSAHQVFHKLDRTLRCHHCGYTVRVPRACPECGNLDLAAVGKGTEQIEEQLAGLLADARRPDGAPVRVARMDADSTRLKGSLEQQLAHVHSGEVDVLVGTQMIAKGHDFRRISLVACINADSGLFASDYRAPERLFALLMQAAGRAGRDASFMTAQGTRAELWVQTWYPQHPLFAALGQHDFAAFAQQQLAEREVAQMPPHGYQALVRAEAKTQGAAQAFLNLAAKDEATATLPGREQVMLYPALPATLQRLANVERAQLLVESPSRKALQQFLAAWQEVLQHTRAHPEAKGLLRWAVDVDPLGV
jgi:primosomal protein N' (replication factor Y)